MKKTMTRVFAIILSAAIFASFTACNQTEGEGDQSNESGSAYMSEEPNSNGNESKGPEASENQSGESSTTPGESDATTPNEGDGTTAPNENAEGNVTTEEPEIPEKTDGTETSIITGNPQQQPSNNDTTVTDKRTAIVNSAKKAVGYDFLFGGDSPEEGGFDNSGLMYYALTQNGISCPRFTNEIAKIGTKVGYDELKPGDLVFFQVNGSGKPDFGGVYIGDGQMVISMSEDIPVQIVNMTTNYYRGAFVHGAAVAR